MDANARPQLQEVAAVELGHDVVEAGHANLVCPAVDVAFLQ